METFLVVTTGEVLLASSGKGPKMLLIILRPVQAQDSPRVYVALNVNGTEIEKVLCQGSPSFWHLWATTLEEGELSWATH